MHFVFGALKSQDRRSHGAYAKELPNCYIAYIHGISTSRNNRSDNFNCPRQQLSKKKKKKPQLTWTKIVLTMEHRQGLSVCSRLAKIWSTSEWLLTWLGIFVTCCKNQKSVNNSMYQEDGSFMIYVHYYLQIVCQSSNTSVRNSCAMFWQEV